MTTMKIRSSRTNFPIPAVTVREAGAVLATAFLLLVATTSQALAAELPPFAAASDILAELMKVLLIAVLMEQAFAVIFNWRLYQEFFSARAFKTLVMIAASWLFVLLSGYDPVQKIIAYAGGTNSQAQSQALTIFLSALIFSGGSAGVNNLLVGLGFRQASTEPKRPEPPTGMAWFSVRIVSHAPLERFAIELADGTAPAASPMLATLNRRTFPERFFYIFLRDPMRFPPSGGFNVKSQKSYVVTLTKIETRLLAQDGGRSETVRTPVWTWSGAFADRAIVDFEVNV